MFHKHYLVLLVALLLVESYLGQKEDKTLIKLDQGLISGKVFKTYGEKKPYFSYQSIPYAEPPIEMLRFQAPVAHKGWNDTLKAHRAGPICMQADIPMRRPYHRSEDCLILNVYTPKLKKDIENDEKFPVMFWIHGGMFKTGSGSKWEFGPDFFIEDNAVLVTINYRIDFPGFVDLEDEIISGNMGLKDVILALKWVRDNIEHFGGDPKSITIFGQDSGAVVVDILLLSPIAKGLFHRAILQSGVSLQPNYFPTGVSPRERAFKVLNYFKKFPGDSKQWLRDFDDLDMMEVIRNYIRVIETLEARYIQRGILPYSPTIEKEGPDAVLTKRPENLTPEINVPVMIGFNSRESTFQNAYYVRKPSFLSYVERDFFFSMPIRGFHFKYRSGLLTEAEQAIKDFYFEEGYVRTRDIHEYINMTTDSFTLYAIDKTVKKYIQHTTAPLYYYRFSYHGELNMFSSMIKKSVTPTVLFGASNGDELCYLFRCVDMKDEYEKIYSDPKKNKDLKMIKRIVRMWVNFAKNGDPTPPEDNVLKGFVWKPVTKDEHNFIDIDKKIKNDISPFADRIAFWDNFIANYSSQAVDGVAGVAEEEVFEPEEPFEDHESFHRVRVEL